MGHHHRINLPCRLRLYSLPYDLILNCLFRISKTHNPIPSLVSKTFESLVTSPDLKAARSRIFNTEKCLYVCLKFNNNPNPNWFILSKTLKHKLIPIPSFPYQHPNRSTGVSTDTEIYMIGGLVGNEKISRRAYLLDCETNVWRQLPKMRKARKEAAVSEYWGEIYNPKTQTWELFPEGEVDVYNKDGVSSCNSIIGGSIFHDCGFVIGGKVYEDVMDNGELHLLHGVCMVQIYHQWFQATISNGKLELVCCDDDNSMEDIFGGLEGISSNYLVSVVNPDGGNRVIVWWKTFSTKECKTEIWCAEVSFRYVTKGFGEL